VPGGARERERVVGPGSCQIYVFVLYFKSYAQNPAVTPPIRPSQGAQLKRPGSYCSTRHLTH
jgi:hypothetical protein